MSTTAVDVLLDPEGGNLDGISKRHWRREQSQDPVLKPWMDAAVEHKRPRRQSLPMTRYNTMYYRNFDSLRLKRGVLYRDAIIDGKPREQLVLPARYIKDVLQGQHDDLGHPGRYKVLSLCKDRFYWASVTTDVDDWIKKCPRCLRAKTLANIRAPLVSIHTSQPMELLCLDYLSLEPSKGGICNILVITDHFTNYAQAIPTRNQTAKTTTEARFNHFIVHYGIPDQGANFESDLMKELCKVLGVSRSRTTHYHPMGNGTTERFNRTLLNMLRTLEEGEKRDWSHHIAPLVHAYNCTRHDNTGFSPFQLMFGREPRLSIDIAFGIEQNSESTPLPEYVDSLKQRLKDSYQLASSLPKKAKNRQNIQYDKKQIGATDIPGIPVFVVQLESGSGKKRKLHRNNLLPIGTLLSETEKPVPAKRTCKPTVRVVSEHTPVDTCDENDEEDDVYHVIDSGNSHDSEGRLPSDVHVEGATSQDPDDDFGVPEDVDHVVLLGDDHISGGEDSSGGGEQQREPEIEEAGSGPRRSARTRRQPQWQRSNDYLCSRISSSKSHGTSGLGCWRYLQRRVFYQDQLRMLDTYSSRAFCSQDMDDLFPETIDTDFEEEAVIKEAARVTPGIVEAVQQAIVPVEGTEPEGSVLSHVSNSSPTMNYPSQVVGSDQKDNRQFQV
ncbi:uncharacterized protein LOC117326432 [Pecten maximus]|uniref:uncharacterized protein LOC117326432 n=1 Tax=Pecten maximus TaxID=6579 RepID=UPI0014584426|nr:uncharacterized protein LOC117326432 [Pecten maximus]